LFDALLQNDPKHKKGSIPMQTMGNKTVGVCGNLLNQVGSPLFSVELRKRLDWLAG
jgi:hypothetical protein